MLILKNFGNFEKSGRCHLGIRYTQVNDRSGPQTSVRYDELSVIERFHCILIKERNYFMKIIAANKRV